jgi:hypothetical protein
MVVSLPVFRFQPPGWTMMMAMQCVPRLAKAKAGRAKALAKAEGAVLQHRQQQ